MEHYAGIDVSLERSSVCVVDATGKIVREAKVASEPEALVRFFRELGLPLARVGLEAGPLSQWLHAGLTGAGSRRCCSACGRTAPASAGARKGRSRNLVARRTGSGRGRAVPPLRGPLAGTREPVRPG